VQVKHTRSDGALIEIMCRSHALTGGRVRTTKRYTAATIDWLAAYDVTTECCYYVPAALLGEGRAQINLRLTPTRNHQVRGIWMAADFLEL